MIDAVRLDVDGGLATLRLDGSHGNAINDVLVGGLSGRIREIGRDPGVRGVMLASAGRLFSPGLDLRELTTYDRPAMDAFLGRFSRCMLALYTLPLPVVAAINGHAIAGGCVLGMLADWRVLARGALIGLNEVKVGVPLPWWVAQVLREAVAGHRLEEICLLGRNYADDEALACGLAHELAEPGKAEDLARERLAEFAGRDTRALGVTKIYLRHAAVARIEAEDERRRGDFLESWFSPPTQERIRAIVEGLGRR
jgi:enoyl-CoA hydratase